jgi:hypothetical protein
MDRLTRLKVPMLDAADRHVVGIGLVIVLAFLLVCGTLGLGLRIFWLAAGL